MNEQKFRELLLYIAHQSRTDRKFGAIKLNKVLYYSDFAAYRLLGQSISGDQYQHLSEGPAPRHLLPVRNRLVRDGAAHLEERSFFNSLQQRLVDDRPPDLSKFNEREIAIVDEVIEELRDYNGAEVSQLSHHEFGWAVTEEGETIPYDTAWFASDLEPLTMEQIAAGIEVARENGLTVSPRSKLLAS